MPISPVIFSVRSQVFKNTVKSTTDICTLQNAFFLLSRLAGRDRMFSKDGLQCSHRKIQSTCSVEEQLTGIELQQFVCVIQWMQSTLSLFTKTIRSPTFFIGTSHTKDDSHKKSAVLPTLCFKAGWNSIRFDTFRFTKSIAMNEVTLSYLDVCSRLFVYYEAFSFFISGMLTQVSVKNFQKL